MLKSKITLFLLSSAIIVLSSELQAKEPFDIEPITAGITFKQPAAGAPGAPEPGRKYNLRGVSLGAGGDAISTGIRYATWSNYSHVGLILSDAEDETKWYCFESTGSAAEVLNGEYPHVRITAWDKMVKDYDGSLSYRLFVYDDEKANDSTNVTKFVDTYNNKSYTTNPMTLIRALFGTNEKSDSEILENVFCSELAAKMLMDLDMIEKGTASNYIPKHFSTDSNLSFKGKIELTPEFKEK